MKKFLVIIEFVTTNNNNDEYSLKTDIESALNNESYIFSDSKFERKRIGIKQIEGEK